MGVLPLILGAMAHFIPVLTRTAPRAGDHRPALLGVLAGLAAVAGQQLWFPLIYPAALLGIAAAGDLLRIAHRRERDCLGKPHPCLRWYQAALICLLLALAALLAAGLWPTQWGALRTLHLHLNLLGFVGLTAFGTLQVLLPTVGGYSDPNTFRRLVSDLPWALAATLAIAVGAATWRPLIWLGLVAWLWITARLLTSLYRRPLSLHGLHNPASALLIALWGWLANLLFAVYHASTAAGGRHSLWVFVCAFLLPLVSGALSHLIPVWLSPGQETLERVRCRARIARYTLVRALLLSAAGLSIAMNHYWGLLAAVLAIGWLLLQGSLAVARWHRA